MRARLGPYAPLSATYFDDDAIMAAGDAAETLFTRGLAFCASSNSDGFITYSQVTIRLGAGLRNVSARVRALIREGLWIEVDGGYLVRTWLQWNKTAEEVGRARAKDRERKRSTSENAPEPDGDPPGHPAGPSPESNGIPRGIQRESDGIPASRAPARPPARARHFTALHGTALHRTELPPYPPATADGTALLEEHKRGFAHTPPRDVQQRTGIEIDKLASQGVEARFIRAGLALLRERTNLGPPLLASLVNEAMNPPKPRRRGPDPDATVSYRPRSDTHTAEVLSMDEWRGAS